MKTLNIETNNFTQAMLIANIAQYNSITDYIQNTFSDMANASEPEAEETFTELQYKGIVNDIMLVTCNDATDTFDTRTINNITNIVDACCTYVNESGYEFIEKDALDSNEVAYELSCYGSIFIINGYIYINTDC